MRRVLALFGHGLGNLGVHPLAHALTLASVLLVTFLAGLFLLLLHNLEIWMAQTGGEVQLQVYWESDANPETVSEQWTWIAEQDGVTEVTTFTPTQALDNLSSSLGGDMQWLEDENPLPHTALVRLEMTGDEPRAAEALRARLTALPGVAEVRANPLQLEAARTWAAFGRKAVWSLVAFLALVAGLTVGNTVRLSLIGRKSEIEILHLVGATEGYIRLPLLVEGAVLGLMGALTAVGLLKLLQLGVNLVTSAPSLGMHVAFMPWPMALGLAALMTLVCTVASWVAVQS